MTKNKSLSQFPPQVFNVFKPARLTSYDVIRHFKRNLPNGYGKIGHFGTLDPFASGVLMIGIGGAARLNDFIHEYLPKTYLAVGKLGIETPTGDYTSEISQRDDSPYLRENMAKFSREFIQAQLREKFLGEYMQAPHKYSASKFMGRNMHEWAREGVEVKKEPVRRFVHSIEVVKFSFPYLSIRVKVSSGTYVRTLFSDMANHLGTIGSLIALVRESVGTISNHVAIQKKNWPADKAATIMEYGTPIQEVLPFSQAHLTEAQMKSFKNGGFMKLSDLKVTAGTLQKQWVWMLDEAGKLEGMAEIVDDVVKPKINFHSVDPADSSSDRDPQ